MGDCRSRDAGTVVAPMDAPSRSRRRWYPPPFPVEWPDTAVRCRTKPGREPPAHNGDASISVDSVVPHGPPSDPNHGVTFTLHVDFGSPLPICTDITTFDNPPVSVDFTDGAPH